MTAVRPLLEVEDLRVAFGDGRRGPAVAPVLAIDGVSLGVDPGEIVAVVGESGSGKSVTALAIMRLLPQRIARVAGGRIRFGGRDLLALDDEAMRRVRGAEIAMIFQEPMTSLNPMMSIGDQIVEAMAAHGGSGSMRATMRATMRARAAELLEQVGIADPQARLDQYPHEFSGGMRQRVMIAIGLACGPKLIIADEPTTALDVTTQAQILDLLRSLARQRGVAVLLITHNLGIVANYADRVIVMYGGRIQESAAARTMFRTPRHPYTAGLLRSVPRLDRPRLKRLETIEGLPPDVARRDAGCVFGPRCAYREHACAAPQALAVTDVGSRSACRRWPSIATVLQSGVGEPAGPDMGEGSDVRPLLSVRGLTKRFGAGAGFLAVDGVSFDIMPGETLGMVGESGSGKSTIGRMILRLTDATAGEVAFDGQDVLRAKGAALAALRRKLQVVFQDPFSSLNPRMTVGGIIGEPLRVHGIVKGGAAVRARVAELLDLVGLRAGYAGRYPHEMSGGQRQRVGIARALAFEPRLIVCDEAVSALDVSIQAQIVNLLQDLQARLGLSLLFIGHDLAVVRHLAARIVVMHKGRLIETLDQAALLRGPSEAYTRQLMRASPSLDGAPMAACQQAHDMMGTGR